MSHLQPKDAAVQLVTAMQIKWHLGHVVQNLRDAKGWSQQKLAQKAGVHKATVVSVERMDRNHGRETLDKIARALGVTLAGLYAAVPQEPGEEAQRTDHVAAGGGFRGHHQIRGRQGD